MVGLLPPAAADLARREWLHRCGDPDGPGPDVVPLPKIALEARKQGEYESLQGRQLRTCQTTGKHPVIAHGTHDARTAAMSFGSARVVGANRLAVAPIGPLGNSQTGR
jgi:hypothetical protein